jgi:hypothetical protein
MKIFLASVIALTVAASAGCGGAPEAGLGTDFEQLTLVSTGGGLNADNAVCDLPTFPETLSIMAATRRLSWDLCEVATSGQVERLTGDRVLTSAELAVVRDSLSRVVPSHQTGCGADASVVVLDLEAQGRVGRYVDDFYAGCLPPSAAGRTLVSKLADLDVVVFALAPPP